MPAKPEVMLPVLLACGSRGALWGFPLSPEVEGGLVPLPSCRTGLQGRMCGPHRTSGARLLLSCTQLTWGRRSLAGL